MAKFLAITLKELISGLGFLTLIWSNQTRWFINTSENSCFFSVKWLGLNASFSTPWMGCWSITLSTPHPALFLCQHFYHPPAFIHLSESVLSVRFEVGVSLLLAPAGADKRGPKAPFPLVENAGIQPAFRERVPAGAPVGARSYLKHWWIVSKVTHLRLQKNISSLAKLIGQDSLNYKKDGSLSLKRYQDTVLWKWPHSLWSAPRLVTSGWTWFSEQV